MKKLLFALIAFIAVSVAAPVAEAGQFARVYTRHGPVYAHKSQLYGNYYGGNYYYGSHHRKHHHHDYYRSYYARPGYYYSRPAYYGYGYPRYGYSSSHCGYHSSPRVSFSIGF